MQTLSYSPGQLVTVFVQTVDGYGVRQDGYVPIITRILYPDLSIPSNFPKNMNRIDVGLYYFQFQLPTGAAAVGSYLVDIVYQDPTTLANRNCIIQVLVSAPYGIYSAIPKHGHHRDHDDRDCNDFDEDHDSRRREHDDEH